MKTYLLFTTIIIFCGLQQKVTAQQRMNILPEFYFAKRGEEMNFFQKDRTLIDELKSIPYNRNSDTIYAIEVSYLEGSECYMMYWSRGFQYSVIGNFGREMKVYTKNIFDEKFVQLVESWEVDSIKSQERPGYDLTQYLDIYRLIVKDGGWKTDYCEIIFYEGPLFSNIDFHSLGGCIRTYQSQGRSYSKDQ